MRGGLCIAMGKLKKWKLVIPIIISAVLVVVSASGYSSNPKINNSDQTKNISAQPILISSFKIAAPFKLISGKLLLETTNFPVYLPTYLPPLYQENEWLLKPGNKNMFSIEIDRRSPGDRSGTGMYAGTLSGNIEDPPGSPLEDQIVSENTEVTTIDLPNGITGKEYIMEQGAGKAISWKVGQWSYFVAAQPDTEVSSAIDSASQIINTIGINGLALSDSPGKLYFFFLNHTFTTIYWKVNDSVWYELDWHDDPSNAINILRSMEFIGVGLAK